jgi:hypothetical protein
MPIGYYRDVPAASSTDPPGAHRIRGPLGVQASRGLAETSLSSRGRSAARASVHPGGQISPYIVASSKILPGAVSGFDRTVTTAPRPRLRP